MFIDGESPRLTGPRDCPTPLVNGCELNTLRNPKDGNLSDLYPLFTHSYFYNTILGKTFILVSDAKSFLPMVG